jgi:hypothetical protein
MRRSGLGALALLVAIPTLLFGGVLPTASAATWTLPSFSGFVADDAYQRVFIGDPTDGTVVAADYAGNKIGSLPGVAQVSDLALSPDGKTVYAAAPGTDQIVAIDAATLTEVTRYTAATTYGPRHVAFAGGKVWFSYGDQWSGNLGSVDPGTGTVTMNLYPNRVWGQALLDTTPSEPNLMAVGETGVSTDSMAVVDTSAASLTPEVAYYRGDYTLNYGIDDIDLIPGSSEVLVNGRERQAYANGSFTANGAYPDGYRADISPTGFVATATDSQVFVFRPDAALPVSTFSGGASALTWAQDESKLFVLRSASYSSYSLSVIDQPTLGQPTLSIHAPISAERAQPLTVTGTISATEPLPASVSLSVVRKDMDHPLGVALPAVPVAADGTWSFQDSPPDGGSVTYAVTYAGDATHRAVSSSATVSVSRILPALSVSPSGTTYAYGARVVFTAHLGTTYRNRALALWVDPYGTDQPRRLARTGTVDSRGDLTVTVYHVRRNTTVSAVFAGDERTAPRTVSVTVKARTSIAVAVTQQYRTAMIGSQRYFWFHRATVPIITTTMSPYPGRSMRGDLQLLVRGTWTTVQSNFFPLDSSGRCSLWVRVVKGTNVKARIRSVYLRQASGDIANATTYGAWTYLYFTS